VICAYAFCKRRHLHRFKAVTLNSAIGLIEDIGVLILAKSDLSIEVVIYKGLGGATKCWYKLV
jgi:hypothetical protein